MSCVFLAESAILVAFKSVGCCLTVLVCVIIALFAFCASKNNLDSVTFFRCHNDLFSCVAQAEKSTFVHAKNYTPYGMLVNNNIFANPCQQKKP